ncbi:MAG: hypothetical protein EOO28_05760 [Comamonadaceae bacterium]|nr:MAG: hypothetical protein EOO28_05760 [Comamonadaceae bacterium]
MKHKIITCLIAIAAAFGAAASVEARAQNAGSELSALSALPVASVVASVGVAGAAASTVVALPVALSAGGAVLVVKTVESTARGTFYLLERASDGAQASIEVAGKAAGGVSVAVGTAVSVGVIASGVVLSVAGEAIAFIPNALGRALMYNERVTY